MKIKSYLWILFFHVIVSSGCGISKNPSTLIIDSPENSKVKKEVKDNLSHYHIIFAEKDNQLTISQMPYPPSSVFISTFIETFTKSFKVCIIPFTYHINSFKILAPSSIYICNCILQMVKLPAPKCMTPSRMVYQGYTWQGYKLLGAQ